MKGYEILARNLTASGYGIGYEKMSSILSRLSEEEIHDLAYNCYRTAEKLGEDAFDSTRLYGGESQ